MVPATLTKLDLIRSGIVEHDLLFSGIMTVDQLVCTMNVRKWSRYLMLRQNERRRYREREPTHTDRITCDDDEGRTISEDDRTCNAVK